jgi:hypothetical protein
MLSGVGISDLSRAIDLFRKVCGLAGSLTFLDGIRADALQAGILEAVAERNTPRIFDWLLNAFSYQGISDQVARGYIHRHGNITWSGIAADIGAAPLPSPSDLLGL